MTTERKHEHFCFAGQPAPCKGYFLNDVLPCVCGAESDVISELSHVAVPPPLGGTPFPAELAAAKPGPVEPQDKQEIQLRAQSRTPSRATADESEEPLPNAAA